MLSKKPICRLSRVFSTLCRPVDPLKSSITPEKETFLIAMQEGSCRSPGIGGGCSSRNKREYPVSSGDFLIDFSGAKSNLTKDEPKMSLKGSGEGSEGIKYL